MAIANTLGDTAAQDHIDAGVKMIDLGKRAERLWGFQATP